MLRIFYLNNIQILQDVASCLTVNTLLSFIQGLWTAVPWGWQYAPLECWLTSQHSVMSQQDCGLWSSLTALWILQILWTKTSLLCTYIQVVIWYFPNIWHSNYIPRRAERHLFLHGSRMFISSQWNACERPLLHVYYLNYTILLCSLKHFSNSFMM
jgi:hypothetical protein